MDDDLHPCILHLEDDPLDARIIAREIQQSVPDARIILVDNHNDFVRELGSKAVTVVCLDHAIADLDTLEAIAIVRRSDPEIPVILLSGKVTPKDVTAALEHGATDYVLKNHLTRLGFVIRRAIREKHERRQRRRTEEQLLQVQKLEAVGELAGGLAHDFNNHLSVILGMVELVLGSGDLSERNAGRLEKVLSAGELASQLVRRMLTLSSRNHDEPEYLDPKVILSETVELLRPMVDPPTGLELDCAPIEGRVLLDPGHLDQILMNLIINASHAIPEGCEDGQILVEAREDRSADNGGRDLRITVTDNGHGMEPEVLRKIFDPFFTTKPHGRGTGLGLSMVHNLVKAGRGEISVRSRAGEGATFDLRFPLVDEKGIDTERLERGVELLIGTEHLLVVDDEPELLELYRSAFSSAGYQVSVAEDGQAALELLERSDIAPDVVITDVRMPRMTGPELVTRLRQWIPKLPVLYVSGFTSDLIDPSAFDDRHTDFLAKPATPATLARRVQRLLSRRSRER